MLAFVSSSHEAIKSELCFFEFIVVNTSKKIHVVSKQDQIFHIMDAYLKVVLDFLKYNVNSLSRKRRA